MTPNDGQRILRGLAVWQASGQTLTHWQQQGQSPLPHPLLKLVVNRPRPLLYEDINRRFLVMMEMGLLAEVKALVAKGLDRQLPAMKAVGYRQLLGHVLDGQPLDLAVTLAMQESRRYAKRQLTWLRGEENAHWLEDDPHQAAFPLVKQFLVEFGFSS